MIKRALGKTGLQVSEVAFGCVEIGMPYGIGVESIHDMPTEQEAIHLLRKAFESGINFFDTARMYGTSENIIGKAFKNNRNRVVIATKCKHFKNSDEGLPCYQVLRSAIMQSLQESLDALQTNYVDVYMVHQADLEIIQSADVREIFTSLKEAGLIRATGVSTYTNEQTEKAIEMGGWDVIQVPFNLMDQRQSVLFSRAAVKGTGIVIRSVLLKGLLSDKGKNLHPALSEVENHLNKYSELTNKLSVNLSTLATTFALSFPEVSSILVGIDKLSYLHQSLEAANGKYLSPEILKHAEALAYPDPAFLDLPKWDREGWLK
jgi:aryl-alcohol dehydrogenase-like predicted oxidoreductase